MTKLLHRVSAPCWLWTSVVSYILAAQLQMLARLDHLADLCSILGTNCFTIIDSHCSIFHFVQGCLGGLGGKNNAQLEQRYKQVQQQGHNQVPDKYQIKCSWTSTKTRALTTSISLEQITDQSSWLILAQSFDPSLVSGKINTSEQIRMFQIASNGEQQN